MEAGKVTNNNKKKNKEIIKSLCGLKFDLKKLFEDVSFDDKAILSFSEGLYEEKCEEIAPIIGEENFELIELLKQIYDTNILTRILKDKEYLSDAYIDKYNAHKLELNQLKSLYRKYGTIEEFDFMFRKDEPGTYSAYVRSNLSKYTEDERKRRRADDTNATRTELLYKNIKAFLSIKEGKMSDEDLKIALSISEAIDCGIFLSKHRTADNSVIPNQIHIKEVAAILKNAEKYLPFLLEKNEYGLTVSEQIKELYSFKIPFFLGPLSEKSEKYGGNGWVVRKEAGKVLPWNISEKVDFDKSRERLIKNLIRECTYISNERVLPKGSLLYESFSVLNEINNISVDGKKISVTQKKLIYGLFKSKNKVSRKDICKILSQHGKIVNDAQITGIDTNIKSSLTSYRRFRDVFGEEIDTKPCQAMCERIIELSTIYGEEKKLFVAALKKEFAGKITDKQIKRIQGYKYKDWGNLSKEFFNLKGVNPETGEEITLIEALYETNYNMMSLISIEELHFKESLEAKKKKLASSLYEFEAEDLKGFYFSAPVRRMIWQSIQCLKETIKIMGCEPKRIFIKMMRSDEEIGDKGRTQSRGSQLLSLYKDIKDKSHPWIAEIKAAQESGDLNRKKLYLYYLQMGRCVYTGKPINKDKLLSENSDYNIDHIYPKCVVNDDNIQNNLVLVDKNVNRDIKRDNYPLMSVSPEVRKLWDTLHENKLMSDEKYNRLVCKEPFSDRQLSEFIAKDFVAKAQGGKGLADILKMLIPDAEDKIVYVKGENIAAFRQKFDLPKAINLNDFNGVKDAYLSIVVGNAYLTKFTRNPWNFISKEYRQNKEKYHYHMDKIFDYPITRNGYTAWLPAKDDEPGTIQTVISVMSKNTPMMSRLTLESKGKLFDETISNADLAKPGIYAPLKTSDDRFAVDKYGGNSSIAVAYFFIAEHTKKGKRIKTIETISKCITAKIKSEEDLLDYCRQIGLDSPKICISKIKPQTLAKIDGYYYRLSGKSGNDITLWNAVSMCLDLEWTRYIHKLEVHLKNESLKEEISKEKNTELYDLLTRKHTESIFRKKRNSINKKLISKREEFTKLKEKDQCKVLIEILKGGLLGVSKVNLSLFGEGVSAGLPKINKNITDLDEFVLINQSVTGFFENSVDVLSI